MKYGLSFLPDSSLQEKTANQYYRDFLELCKLADEGGMSAIKMTQHYLNPYGGYSPNPLSLLMGVAACTNQIRLMTGGVIPAFFHPIKLAAEISMLDSFSNGRAEIGFARGFLPYEFDAFNIPLNESRDRFEKTIEAVLDLLTKENVTHDTSYFKYRNVTNFPECMQKPHPPMWCAGARSRETFSWIAEKKINLMMALTIQERAWIVDQISIYKEEFPEGKITLLAPMLICDDQKNAEKLAKYYIERYHKVWQLAACSWNGIQSTSYPGYTNMSNFIKSHNYDKIKLLGNAFIGTPERVKDEVHKLCEDLKVDQLLFNIDMGSMPIEHSRNTLDNFLNIFSI